MNGRTENKIKVEQKTIKKINESEFELNGFYNYMSSKYEHKTKELYINYVLKFLRSVNKSITDITYEDISIYLTNLIYKEDENVIKETSGTYRATIHSALKLYFSYLNESHIINNNPILSVPRPKSKKDSLIERVYLESDELQKIINNVIKKEKNMHRKNRDLLMLMIFLYTGIRCTALTEINIEDIDIKKKTLTVIDKRNKKRTYNIDDDLVSLYQKVVNDNKRFKGKTNALFVSNRGLRMTSSTVSKTLEKYSFDIDKHVTPHKLRRSFGTTLYKETGDIYAVKSALGHEDIRTTQIYVNTSDTEASTKGMLAMKNKIKF
jgi:integrase/recombinase XerC